MNAAMVKRIFLVVALLAIGLGVTGYSLLRMSFPMLDEDAQLRGLSAPVTLERDPPGVPTVRGQHRRTWLARRGLPSSGSLCLPESCPFTA